MLHIHSQDVTERWRHPKITAKKETTYYVESKIKLRVKVLAFGWILSGE